MVCVTFTKISVTENVSTNSIPKPYQQSLSELQNEMSRMLLNVKDISTQLSQASTQVDKMHSLHEGKSLFQRTLQPDYVC